MTITCWLLSSLLFLVACSASSPVHTGSDADVSLDDADVSLDDADVNENDTDIGASDADASSDAPDDGTVDSDTSCLCDYESPELDRPTYMFHDCTPPLETGCEAITCTPDDDDCPDGYSCAEWGAAACCVCAAAVPACVRTEMAMGPLPEYLAIAPASGPAGEEQEIRITGFPFYVGALFYPVRVGDSDPLFTASHLEPCVISVRIPARPPGMVPIWVGAYGGDGPDVLAGFFTFSGGVTETCVQPGYQCLDGTACCETADVPMSCQEQRCRME